MTGGGTGGHLYPALAIAEKIKEREPDSDILFLGEAGGMESEIVPKNGYAFRAVPARWFYREEGFWYTVKEFFKASKATLAGIRAVRGIVKEFRPDAVIGTGGFVSVPVIIGAHSRKVPCYIHEQNARPGLGNKIMQRFCDRIFLGISGAEAAFKDPSKTEFTGNPVRAAFLSTTKESAREKLGIPQGDKVLFTFGGSLGSKAINDIAWDYAKRIAGKEGYTLLFGTGNRWYDGVLAQAEEEGVKGDNIRIYPYIEDMPNYIAAADLVVCRSGALSMAEVAVTGRASVLIPYPWAANDHQYYNAKSIADAGGALLYRQEEVEPEKLVDEIFTLLEDPERLAAMGEAAKAACPANATDRIYEGVTRG